jgi:parallel beta-helix repeat protein
MKNIRLIIFTISLFTFLIGKSQVYVDINATGLNNGTSWKDAYRSLDTAMFNTNSGEIWVASGIYTPSIPINGDNDDRNVAFFFKPNVSCYGGFNGNEISKLERNITLNLTVLSGDIGEKGNFQDNVYHVIYNDYDDLDTNAVFDGFVIYGAYGGSGWDDGSGGGLYLDKVGTPVIRNCIITNNKSSHGGGFSIDRSEPIIENNLIANNEAYEGAGILLGYSDAIIRYNKIVQNIAKGGYSALDGGGIAVESYSSPEIVGNLIANNKSGDEGGGIHLSSNYDVNVFNNIIINNESEDGGGVFVDGTSTNFINNLIVKNKADESGGGIYMDYTGNTRLINNTVSLNTASNGGGLYMTATNTEIINNIIYYNEALKNNITFHNEASNSNQAYIYIGRADWRPEFTFNKIEGGMDNIGIRSDSYSNYSDSILYDNNNEYKPIFLDTLNNNYQIDSISDAVNGGIQDTASLNLLKFDFYENPRIYQDTVDIGAIEYNGYYNPVMDILNLDSINTLLQNIDTLIYKNITYVSNVELTICEGDSIHLGDDFQQIAGEYYDTLTHRYGGDSIIVTQLNTIACVSGINNTHMDEVILYPNPCSNYLNINNNKFDRIYIYRLDGTLIYNKLIKDKSRIDVSELETGLYIVKLDDTIIRLINKTN